MRYIINLALGLVWCAVVAGIAGWHRAPYALGGWVIGFVIFEAAQHCVQWMRRRAASKSDKSMATHH